MQMGPAVAEQRQHRPHIARHRLDQLGQAVFARAIEATEQFVPTGQESLSKELRLEDIAFSFRKRCDAIR